jgi:hypothetical protein
MRRLAVFLIASVCAIPSGVALADPPPLLSGEPADGLPSLQASLPADLLALTDLDPTSLVVTDDELALAGSTLVVTSSLDAPHLVVDDDLAQCPQADFTSINAAIQFAEPGAIIRVCPGDYNENVLVDRTVRLQGQRHHGQASQCQATFPPDPTQVPIIRYPNVGVPAIGVNIQANNVELRGFTVLPLATPPPSGGVGIFTGPLFSGHTLDFNVVERNTTGVYLNASGATETLVRHNCIRDNNFPPGGAAAGNGIYSDQGLNNATIDNNFFTGQTNAAVVIDRFIGTVTNVRITHNTAIDDNAFAISNTFFDFGFGTTIFQNIVISHNFNSRATNGSAIFMSAGVQGAEISYNRLENGNFNGISIRNDVGGGPSSVDVLISKNKATGFARSGIRLSGPAGTNTHIQKNRSANNTFDGMRAEANDVVNGIVQASDYFIEQNHMRDNAEHDCHDGSAGGGTAGTANFWIDNFGFTQNRPGLCKHAK